MDRNLRMTYMNEMRLDHLWSEDQKSAEYAADISTCHEAQNELRRIYDVRLLEMWELDAAIDRFMARKDWDTSE